MFDLNDESTTRLKRDTPIDRLQVDAPAEEDNKPEHPLDGERGTELHSRLMSYYRQELDRQSENRFEQALDEAYYDNEQWSDEEKKILEERGQAATVYNVIATSVDWIIGSEKRGRTDFKILPRGKEDSKPAEAKTKFMKYLSDVNRTPFSRSLAFEDTVKVGIGWLEEAVQDEDDGEPVYCGHESWRNMLWDSAGSKLDCADWRYQFRSKWVDEDIAKALFPGREAAIEQAVMDSTLYVGWDIEDGDLPMDSAEFERENSGINSTIVTHQRRRVRLIEAWYRAPEKVKKLRGGMFSGDIYDESDRRHTDAVAKGAFVVEKVMMRMRVAIMTTTGLLYEGPSPYRHNRFKFIPIWGFRRGKNGLPYGVIRRMRDIQDGVNKAKSKAQYILSTNKVVIEDGALPDDVTYEDFADEVSRPDAIIRVKSGKISSIKFDLDRELAPAFLDMMGRDIQMIQQAGGVTDELLGRTTNAVSGIAVERRQEQGSLATSKFFDNLRFAEQLRGEIELSLMEQYVTEEKQFRITNQRGTPEFVAINDGLPENDITRSKADFVISEADWRATMRQAAVDQLTEMLVKMPPQVAMVMLDLLVESMDIPNRDEIVKRIRTVNGQRDPDATELTPEEQAQQQAQAEAQAMQARAAMAEILEKEAKVDKTMAETDRIKKQAINDSVTATNTAMQAAQSVVMMPTIAKVADGILGEAGWNTAHAVAAQGLPAQPVAPAQQPPMAPNRMVQADQPQPLQ